MKRDYAEYQATYKLDGTTFIAARTLDMHQDELPPARSATTKPSAAPSVPT